MRRMDAVTVFVMLVLLALSTGCGILRIDGTRYGMRTTGSDANAIYESPRVINPESVSSNLIEVSTNGSLFHEQGAAWNPYANPVARSVGDTLTVRISVSVGAEEAATTALSRSSNIEAGIKSLFAYETEIANLGPNPSDPEKLISASSSNEFDGDGETSMSKRLVADVTAEVTHVYPNGNMVIHGSQSSLVNNEKVLVTIDGIVRADDVENDNTVLSDRVANGRITFTGSGPVGDKQRPGWLSRILDGNRNNFTWHASRSVLPETAIKTD